MTIKRKLVLSHTRSPGDIICLTALARDIQLTYPGDFEIFVDTTCKDLWKHSPHVQLLDKQKPPAGATYVKANYGAGLREQNTETIHFCAYFHRDFKKQTGIHVPLVYPHGDLHLSAAEKEPMIDGRYWCMISGGKSDFTIKVWETRKFQQVADALRERGIGIVQLGDTDKGHWHPRIEGALDLVGKTNLRDMLSLIHGSDGVVCGITAAMHGAAALGRPCVVLAGGREAWWWEAYCKENAGLGGKEVAAQLTMPHRFLHTIGVLPCCPTHGCWRNKTIATGGDKSVCEYPVATPGQHVPKCLHLIEASHVIEACMSYYEDRSLPPIVPTPEAMAAGPAMVKKELPIPRLARQPTRTLSTTVTPAPRPLITHPGPINRDALDHHDVGSRFTVFVLFYGGDEYHQMHKRCIDSIVATISPARLDLRVGSNALGPKSLEMLTHLCAAGTITKHYQHTENAYKYPVMREMFHDATQPITTKWVIWFDDDSMADRNPDWLAILAHAISTEHRRGNVHMFGAKFTWTLTPAQQTVFKSRPWYKQRQFRMKNGQPAPNGNQVVFCAGGFWAITHEAILAADIPDLGTGLQNNGGDWQIGEQLYQAGMELRAFNTNKQVVNTSSVPRRGVTTATPGTVVAGRVIPPPPPALKRAPVIHRGVPRQGNINGRRTGLTIINLK